MSEGAVLVENATLPGQRVRPLVEVTEPQVPYFSLILAGRARAPRMSAGPAIVSLGPRSADLAARLQSLLPGAEIHAPACADCAADIRFAKAAPHIGALFAAGRPIVGVCAAGILIRAVGAASRRQARRAAGRRGGRGRLARSCRCSAAITAPTSSPGASPPRSASRPPSPPPATPASASRSTSRPPAGPSPTPPTPSPSWPRCWRAAPSGSGRGRRADWLRAAALPLDADGRNSRSWSPHRDRRGDPARLVYPSARPGARRRCERGAPPEALIALVRDDARRAGLARMPSPASSRSTSRPTSPPSTPLAAALGVPARFFPAERLAQETDRLANPSEAVFRETGCWGVAEGAALAAAGPDGRLLVPKRKGARVTCAIALAPDAARRRHASAARAAGSRSSASAPAAPTGAPPRHERLLAEAERPGRLRPLSRPARRRSRRQGAPRLPARRRGRALPLALDRAAEGRVGRAGLLRRSRHLRPGDPGLRAARPRQPIRPGRASPITVSPGVSALQAAAAGAGAPLGHDFCAISLSDLLTPVEAIERRIRAAAAGDFVVAFYNPVSQRRREQLGRARDLLLEHRPADTPGDPRPQSRPPDARPRRDPPRRADRRPVRHADAGAGRQLRHAARAAPARPGLGLHPARLPRSR